MKISSTGHRIAAVIALVVILTAVGGVGRAAGSRPAGMSKAAYESLAVRSAGLDEKYRIGAWKGVPQGMTLAAYRALAVRSEALDKRYGLGTEKTVSVARTRSVSTREFSWGAFGIGAVAMLGLVLVATGLLAGAHYGRKSGVRPRPTS
jgi:hypothetical protein